MEKKKVKFMVTKLGEFFLLCKSKDCCNEKTSFEHQQAVVFIKDLL